MSIAMRVRVEEIEKKLEELKRLYLEQADELKKLNSSKEKAPSGRSQSKSS